MANHIGARIQADLEMRIRTQFYHSGKKLPSVRELSEQYQCSKSTVVAAYETLKQRHLVYSVPQSGYFCVENQRLRGENDSNVINFSTGNPIIGTIHIPDLKHCLDRSVDLYEHRSLCQNPYGVESLRQLLTAYLTDFQVFTRPENVFVNLGVQQGLSILTALPFPNGRQVILVEEPTYRYYLDFLRFQKVPVEGIDRTEQGIDLNRLERLFKTERIKFFYTVPRNHNPLGTAYRRSQRKAIAALASKYHVYIVEDDYFGDVTETPGDTLFAEGDHDHFIYLKNYTKIIPWIRIGLMVIPTPLIPAFQQAVASSYYDSYFSPSLVSQATLEIYLRSQLLKKQVHLMQKELAERLRCLRKSFNLLTRSGVKCVGGESGFYSYLQLPEGMDANRILEKLEKQGVLVSGSGGFYIEPSAQNSLRLSVARTSTAEIKCGVAIIQAALKT